MISEEVLDFYAANDWKCVNCGWLRRECQHFKQSSVQEPETCTGSNEGETHEAEWDVRAGFQRACT